MFLNISFKVGYKFKNIANLKNENVQVYSNKKPFYSILQKKYKE